MKQEQERYKRIGQYGPSRVMMTKGEIEDLINRYPGTVVIRLNRRGDWDNKETILNNNKIIGVVIDNRHGSSAETTVFRIHYANNRLPIVPDYPSKKKGGG